MKQSQQLPTPTHGSLLQLQRRVSTAHTPSRNTIQGCSKTKIVPRQVVQTQTSSLNSSMVLSQPSGTRVKLQAMQASLADLDPTLSGRVKLVAFTRLWDCCGLPWIEPQLKERLLSRFTLQSENEDLIDYRKACEALKMIYRQQKDQSQPSPQPGASQGSQIGIMVHEKVIMQPLQELKVVRRKRQAALTALHFRETHSQFMQNRALNENTKLEKVIHACGDYPEGATGPGELENRENRRMNRDFPFHNQLVVMPTGEEIRVRQESRSRMQASYDTVTVEQPTIETVDIEKPVGNDPILELVQHFQSRYPHRALDFQRHFYALKRYMHLYLQSSGNRKSATWAMSFPRFKQILRLSCRDFQLMEDGLSKYWTRDLLDRLFEAVGITLVREGKVIQAIEVAKVERFVDMYLGIQTNSILRSTAQTFNSHLSKDSHFTSSSSIDFRGKFESKEDEFRDNLSKLTDKMRDRNLPCETAADLLSLFDVKQQGKASFADFRYTLSMLRFHLVKRDMMALFQYLDGFTQDGHLDLSDFQQHWVQQDNPAYTTLQNAKQDPPEIGASCKAQRMSSLDEDIKSVFSKKKGVFQSLGRYGSVQELTPMETGVGDEVGKNEKVARRQQESQPIQKLMERLRSRQTLQPTKTQADPYTEYPEMVKRGNYFNSRNNSQTTLEGGSQVDPSIVNPYFNTGKHMTVSQRKGVLPPHKPLGYFQRNNQDQKSFKIQSTRVSTATSGSMRRSLRILPANTSDPYQVNKK